MRWIDIDDIEANGERCHYVDVDVCIDGDNATAAGDLYTDELGELTSYVDTFLAGLYDRVGEFAGQAGHRPMAALLGQVERVVRGAEAASVAVVDDVAARSLYLDDHHRTLRSWVEAMALVGGDVALGRVRMAKLFRQVPHAGELLAEGKLGVAQARELARAAANPRCGDRIGEVADELLESVMSDDVDTFRDRAREWVRLTDEDGAHREARTAHEDRHCQLSRVGDRYVLSGSFGVIQGETLLQVLDAYAEAEFLADRDNAIATFGEDVPEGHLARTPTQRRADALVAIGLAAAAAPPGAGKEIDVCVNIVIDHRTFEQQLADMIADLVDPLHTIRNQRPDHQLFTHEACGFTSGLDPDTDVRPMCHTINGSPVDTVHAVVMAAVGHVRRVVLGANGVVIDLGRKRRCFTGSVAWPCCCRPRSTGRTDVSGPDGAPPLPDRPRHRVVRPKAHPRRQR